MATMRTTTYRLVFLGAWRRFSPTDTLGIS